MIDEARLRELVEDFGADEVPDLIELFLDETWEALDGLEALATGQSSASIADHFHFLKGSGRNIGASEFADACAVLEAGEISFTTAEYQKLRSLFQAVTDYFRSGSARLTA